MKRGIAVICLLLIAVLGSGCTLFGGDPLSTPMPTLEPLPPAPTPIPTLEPLSEFTPEPDEDRTPSPGNPDDDILYGDVDDSGEVATLSPDDDGGSDDSGEEKPSGGGYSNAKVGFSGTAPSGYDVTERDTFVTFTEDISGDGFATRMTVQIKSYSTDNDNLRDHAEIAAEDLISKYGAKLTDRTTIDIAGKEGLQYTVKGETEGGTSVKGRIGFTISDGRMIIIMFMTTSEKYDSHVRVYNDMLESFALT